VSEKMATPVYLGVWNSLTPISDEEAARQYRLLCDMEATPRRFDAEVYAFYSRLISLYPEVDSLPEDELDGSPWACSMEVSDSHENANGRPAGSDACRRKWAGLFRSPGRLGLPTSAPGRKTRRCRPIEGLDRAIRGKAE
jgi:hypothetical protein